MSRVWITGIGAVGLLTLAGCSDHGGAPAANTLQTDGNRDAAIEAQADNLDALAENFRDDTDRAEEASDASIAAPDAANRQQDVSTNQE